MSYGGHPDQRFGHISYSQHGDDMFLLNLFDLLKIQQGRYLDLGAHHPESISNTALLYKRGWRGVNVDASAKAIELFNRSRPDDRNILSGVGPESGTGEFLMFADNHGRNTFSKRESMSWGGPPEPNKVQVPIATLTEIINRHCDQRWPDFINMDIEGYDLMVLLSLDARNRPTTSIWCVECRPTEELLMKATMLSLGYIPLCRLIANIVFVRNDLIGKVR